MSKNLYPLLMKPVYKDYLWGGDTIIKKYDRKEPAGIYAESWEVSARNDGMSIITNGDLAGKSLADVVELWGRDLLGSLVKDDEFPLLIKLIDAKQCLSVQVHPDDATADKVGGEPKTECWYVLSADPTAAVYAGFKEDSSKEEFLAAVKEKRSGDLLYRTLVEEGDTIFIPGGVVHTIDAGCLMLEVQQNSNTTYRIDDWGRIGPDGKERELHLEQAVDVIRWEVGDHPIVAPQQIFDKSGNERWLVIESDYFRLDKIKLHESEAVKGFGASFVVLFVTCGTVEVVWEDGSETLVAGTSCLIPAGLNSVKLVPIGEGAEILKISLPEKVEVIEPEVMVDDQED